VLARGKLANAYAGLLEHLPSDATVLAINICTGTTVICVTPAAIAPQPDLRFVRHATDSERLHRQLLERLPGTLLNCW
jgi:hypothetical protein